MTPRLSKGTLRGHLPALQADCSTRSRIGRQLGSWARVFQVPIDCLYRPEAEQDYCTWPGFRVLPCNELPSAAARGVTHDAWILDSPHYLLWLKEQLVAECMLLPSGSFVSYGTSYISQKIDRRKIEGKGERLPTSRARKRPDILPVSPIY
jgi:hypothetical protein